MAVSKERKLELDLLALQNFREYLRIPSVHPNIDYDDCVNFLQKQAASLDLPCKIHECSPGNPAVIITWPGTHPELPSILLNSHMDVVPANEEKWTYPPFDAHIDENGKIYGRGTQDMKSIGVQYIEAIRYLKECNIQLKRTVHLSFVPDEEAGGEKGMKQFVQSEEFRDLNVGLALDEADANPGEEFLLYYGEKSTWQIHLHCPGKPGHGSLLLEDTAGEKVAYILKKIYEFREEQIRKLHEKSILTNGDIFSVNLTRINGGVQSNVLPSEIVLVVDCRIPVTADINEWENTVRKWCKDAGSDVWLEYEQKNPLFPVTKLDQSNPFWLAFEECCHDMSIKLKKKISPGASDARFIRNLGIPAFCFAPINNTPTLLHDDNEYITVDTFLKGVEIYTNLITAVANLEC